MFTWTINLYYLIWVVVFSFQRNEISFIMNERPPPPPPFLKIYKICIHSRSFVHKFYHQRLDTRTKVNIMHNNNSMKLNLREMKDLGHCEPILWFIWTKGIDHLYGPFGGFKKPPGQVVIYDHQPLDLWSKRSKYECSTNEPNLCFHSFGPFGGFKETTRSGGHFNDHQVQRTNE